MLNVDIEQDLVTDINAHGINHRAVCEVVIKRY